MHNHLPKVKKAWFRITKKGKVLHCVATVMGCVCLSGPAVSADFTIDNAEVNVTQVLDTSGDTGTVTTTGNINVADDKGVYISGSEDMTLTNAGLISSTGSLQSAYGVYADYLKDSSISNFGTVTATTFSTDDDAFGFKIRDFYSSTITNSGTITATAEYGDANGIQTGQTYLSTISNSDTITVTATDGDANGIETNDMYSSTITNSGTITATAENEDAYGITNDDEIYLSTITNSGTITVTTKNEDAYGIYANFVNESTIDSSGTITATAEAGEANGFYIDHIDDSIITNSGTIIANSTDGDAYGIETGWIRHSTITNSGTITTTTTYGDAYGIKTSNVYDSSTITNSGTINTTVTDGDAYGIKTHYLDLSTITNSGAITTTATDGDAYGIKTSNVFHSTINNSSTINATATNGDTFGFKTGSLNYFTTITNSGTITATSDYGYAFGLKADEVFNSSSISNSSTGRLYVTGYENSSGVTASQLTGNSSISNAGLIRVTSSDELAIGIGVNLMYDNSSLINTGTIEVTNTNVGNSDINAGIWNKYSDTGTTITNEGTINVTVAGDSAISAGILAKYASGTINNSGTITLTQDNSFSYSHVPSAGILSWYLSTATINNSGLVQVLHSDGTISNNTFSVISSGNLNNSSTGVLKGLLYVHGDVENSGTISLPLSPYFGWSGVVGTLNNSGTIGITFFNDDDPMNTQYSVLLADGEATLQDSSTIAVDVTSASEHQGLMIGQTLTGVIQADSIVADPTQINTTDNSALLKFVPLLSHGDSWLDLSIEKGQTILEATIASGRKGVNGAAETLDGLVDDGTDNSDINEFLATLNSYETDDQIGYAVAQASPVNATSSPTISNQLLNTMSSVIDARLESVRGMSSGEEMFADRNFWVKPMGAHTSQGNRNGHSGFSANSYGIGIGADGEYSVGNRLGLAFFYTNVDVNTKGINQGNDLDVFNLMAYGSNPIIDESTELFYQFGGGLQQTDSRRHIDATGETAKADFTSKSLFAQVKGTKTLQQTEKLKTNIGLGLSYIYFDNPSYHEHGAGGMNLDVKSFDTSALVASIDGDLFYTLEDGLDLLASASIGYDLIDDDTTVNSSFQGGGAVFDTDGINNSPVIFKLGLGLAKQVNDDLSIDVKYDMDGRTSELMNYMVTAQMNWKF